MRRTARDFVAGGVGVAAVFGLALALAHHASPTDPRARGLPEPRLGSETELVTSDLVRAREALLEEQQGPTTAREFLARFYGERWAEIEAAMSAAHVDLDVPYAYLPWEDVELQFRQDFQLPLEQRRSMIARSLAWPEELSPEWLRENYRVAPECRLEAEDLDAIARAAAPFNAAIRARSELWAALLAFQIRRCSENGSFLRAPFSTVGLSRDVGFYSKSVAGFGWAATMTLRRADYPEMAALDDELFELRRERDLVVASRLRAGAAR